MQTKIKLYPSIKMLETNQFKQKSTLNWEQDFSLEEKLDGSNISFIKYNEQLYCFSRNQLITPQAFKDFDQFLNQWGDLISKKLKNGEVLNAEYIKQGRIKYIFDENQVPNLVLFDLGVVKKQWLDYIFNNQAMPNEDQVAKINFYPINELKTRFKDQPFKFATIKPIKINPIYDLDGNVEDLIIECDQNHYRLSDQFEAYLDQQYFQGHSLIFKDTNSVEGIILKSADGQIRLKYVFQAWKNLRKSKMKKGYKSDELNQELIDYLENAINDRWEKLFNHLHWDDRGDNPFKGVSDIKKLIQKQPQLISSLLKFKTWMVDDIYQELEAKGKFDKNYFKNHWQIICRLVHQLMKRNLQAEIKVAGKIQKSSLGL